jgi:multidrug efflux pump subunit AcrB
VPLGSVAHLYNRRGIDLIRHSDGQLAVTVSADVDPQVANALAITGRLERDVLPEILAPPRSRLRSRRQVRVRTRR